MWEPNDNASDNQDGYLNDNDDLRPEAGSADAAELNELQYEESLISRHADESDDAANEQKGEGYEHAEGTAQRPLTTQGDSAEMEENMGGTTNLSLDQLKREHDPEGNPNE